MFGKKMVDYLDWNLFVLGAHNYDGFWLLKSNQRRSKICDRNNIAWFTMIFDCNWLKSKGNKYSVQIYSTLYLLNNFKTIFYTMYMYVSNMFIYVCILSKTPFFLCLECLLILLHVYFYCTLMATNWSTNWI